MSRFLYATIRRYVRSVRRSIGLNSVLMFFITVQVKGIYTHVKRDVLLTVSSEVKSQTRCVLTSYTGYKYLSFYYVDFVVS